jgi:hypothetical protein
MIWAQKMGMTNGEYVYFYPRTHSTGVRVKEWEQTGIDANGKDLDDGFNMEAKMAYRSIFFVSV